MSVIEQLSLCSNSSVDSFVLLLHVFHEVGFLVRSIIMERCLRDDVEVRTSNMQRKYMVVKEVLSLPHCATGGARLRLNLLRMRQSVSPNLHVLAAWWFQSSSPWIVDKSRGIKMILQCSF